MILDDLGTGKREREREKIKKERKDIIFGDQKRHAGCERVTLAASSCL